MKRQASPFCLDSCCFHLGDLIKRSSQSIFVSEQLLAGNMVEGFFEVGAAVALRTGLAQAPVSHRHHGIVRLLRTLVFPSLSLHGSLLRQVGSGFTQARVLPHVDGDGVAMLAGCSCCFVRSKVMLLLRMHSWHTCAILNNDAAAPPFAVRLNECICRST